MKLRGRLGRTLLALTIGTASACSSGGGGKPGGTDGGGTAGRGGAQAGAGGSAGGGGSATDGGVDAPVVPVEPLCPTNGPITAGTTALPDGVEVVSTATDVEFIALTDSYAYWANETKIFRAPVAAGGAEMIVVDRTASQNHIEGLAVADDFVYWSDSGIHNALGIARAPADGSGAPASIIAGNSYQHVVVADGYVYSNDLGSREIVRAPVAGGERTVLVREVFPSKMAVTGGNLYVVHPYVNATTNVNLLRIPVTTVAPSPDAGAGGVDAGVNIPPGAERVTPVSNYHSESVAADATHIFYDDDSKAMRVPIAGGMPNIVYKIPDTSDIFGPVTHYMGAVVPYAGNVYWAPESSGCDALFMSNGAGTVHTPYVQKIFGPFVLAVNATHVYMAVRGQVVRAPRPQ